MSDKGHLSQVANFAASASTGNLKIHVSCKHDVVCRSNEKCAEILSYISKYKSDQSVGATSKHEVSRDITIWFCRDLLTGARRRDHITPMLRQLHWLPVRQRVTFKIAVLHGLSVSDLSLIHI